MIHFNFPNILSLCQALYSNNREGADVTGKEISSKSQDSKMVDRGGWDTEPFRDNTSGMELNYQ